ncbi:caspase domain-containing protein [Roridomyces roridus]|uniref:Caspase domain-containing protein n=1 Tax=Roridomyces roridus TaxID=1738132 RepID=A0AAD7CE88_9AGAR|nr:caspase domain-containing protein [Roridomyces roridus]
MPRFLVNPCCPPFGRRGSSAAVEEEEHRHLPSPSPARTAAASTSSLTPTGKKKALLIAISKTKGYADLKVAHKDVHDMRELIMGPQYGYLADDITTLKDDGVAGHTQPTRVNILAAIAEFVNDVKAGDRLFFHYCGHSTQVKNRSNSEEDGMDECLVPLDGEDMKIVDNELHKALVLPLPAGCTLVAVLDTCHSGSLLDLKHYRCNRVPVPWIFRGRRDSEDIRNRVVRRGAQLLTLTEQRTRKTGPSRFLSRHMKISVMCESQEAPTSSSAPAPAPAPVSRRSTTAASRASTRSRAPTLSVAPGKENTRPILTVLPCLKWVLPEEEDIRCESPIGQFPCDGWCRKLRHEHGKGTLNEHGGEEDEVKADVISLASCKDSQQAWDDGKGKSMTSMLINYLKHASNPTLKDVLIHMSHGAYSMSLERHKAARSYKQQMKNFTTQLMNKLTRLEKRNLVTTPAVPTTVVPAAAQQRGRVRSASLLQPAQVPTGGKQAAKIQQKLDEAQSQYVAAKGDMDNFQNPELASPRPLDMTRPWTM